MNISEGKRAIEKVAQKHGISVAEVRKEMELAIEAAMANPDHTAKEFWDKYIKSGRRPTPEEFIVYIANKVK